MVRRTHLAAGASEAAPERLNIRRRQRRWGCGGTGAALWVIFCIFPAFFALHFWRSPFALPPPRVVSADLPFGSEYALVLLRVFAHPSAGGAAAEQERWLGLGPFLTTPLEG